MPDVEPEFEHYQALIERISQRETVDQVVMVGLGEAYDERRIAQSVDRRSHRKVYSVFIEMVQNVLHHSAARPAPERAGGAGVVVLSEADGHYAITSGNMVAAAALPDIIARIDRCNRLDRDGLRKAYGVQRKAPLRKGAKGSGLGFIDIRRKTGCPLEAETEPIDEGRSFLVIRTRIDKGGSDA